MLFLKGVMRPAAHIDEVLVVHLHNVVQQRLSCLGQKTGDKRIALRWRESFQRLRVVSLGQLRKYSTMRGSIPPSVIRLATISSTNRYRSMYLMIAGAEAWGGYSFESKQS
jgi:hypothetical protein